MERRERKKWTPADDEVLISAWLNTSKDTIVGNDQKFGTFWHRVGKYYAASPLARARGEKREHLNCKQRWHKINKLTNKFYGAFAAAERQQSSGQNDTFQDEDISFCVKMPTELFNTLDRRARLHRPVHKQLKLDLIENI